jgi:hypothetical protein
MYLTPDEALVEVKSNPATKGLFTAVYDAWATNQLEISAGKNPEQVTVYRPYYVAAKFLEQLRSQQTISEADGAKFTGLALPIASLLSMQAALDTSLGLTVPPGFEAIATAGSAPRAFRFASGTRTIPTQIRP